jgi:hypothetical protein
MNNVPRLIIPCVAAVMSLACGADMASHLTVTKTERGDSIDIAQLWHDQWPALAMHAVDTIIRPDDADGIGRLGAIAVAARGHMAYHDDLGLGVYVIDAATRSKRLVVRTGGGPAELNHISGLWWAGDSLHVYDGVRGQVIVVGLGGDVVSERRLWGNVSSAAMRRVVTGDAHTAVIAQEEGIHPGYDPGVHRPDRLILRVKSGDSRVDTVLVSRGRTWFRDAGGYGLLPLAPVGLTAGAGRSYAVADAATGVIEVLRDSGIRATVVVFHDEAPSARANQTSLVERVAALVPPEQQEDARRMVKSWPLPDSLPRIGGVLGSDEVLWLAQWYAGELEQPGMPWPATQWRVVRLGGGVQVMRVSMPPGMLPVGLKGSDSVAVHLRDSFGRDGIGVMTFRHPSDVP